MVNESPSVFFSTLLGISIGIPTFAYLVNQINANPKGIAHQKIFYTGLIDKLFKIFKSNFFYLLVYRPEDYPKELHQHCR